MLRQGPAGRTLGLAAIVLTSAVPRDPQSPAERGACDDIAQEYLGRALGWHARQKWFKVLSRHARATATKPA